MPPILAIGYSARALAQAVVSSGRKLHLVADHFGDSDCQFSGSEHHRIGSWRSTHAIKDLVRKIEECPRQLTVLFAGGLENWPELMDELAPAAQIWGPTKEQLYVLRNWGFWRSVTERSGIGFPDTRNSMEFVHVKDRSVSNSKWLTKTEQSAGGLGVSRFREGDVHLEGTGKFYFQQHISGRCLGVHAVLTAGEAYLLGITQAWDRQFWPGPTEFIYRGSWGPIQLKSFQLEQLKYLANTIRQESGLLGWVQFDVIEDEQLQLWLLEINPRWAAGMEILVRSHFANPVEWHCQAWTHPCKTLHTDVHTHSNGLPLVSKVVLYAERDIEFRQRHNEVCPEVFEPFLNGKIMETAMAFVADVPAFHGSRICVEHGHPICTLICEMSNESRRLDSEKIEQQLLCVHRNTAAEILHGFGNAA
ncbi:MAG: ATP-grasp domain-containing protein [Planctomycetales bacterium]|nr:ATP-grasp domain-containing protein [Planctomycetales bacterium]